MDRNNNITFEIISNITSNEGCNYTDLPPIYETVDTEAVTALLESDDVCIEFSYCGYDVIVENQEVTINQ